MRKDAEFWSLMFVALAVGSAVAILIAVSCNFSFHCTVLNLVSLYARGLKLSLLGGRWRQFLGVAGPQ